MMSQEAVNNALGVLVEASIKHDTSSTLIGTKALRHATSLQLDNARHYCRIKFGYTNQAIADAIARRPAGLSDSATAWRSRGI